MRTNTRVCRSVPGKALPWRSRLVDITGYPFVNWQLRRLRHVSVLCCCVFSKSRRSDLPIAVLKKRVQASSLLSVCRNFESIKGPWKVVFMLNHKTYRSVKRIQLCYMNDLRSARCSEQSSNRLRVHTADFSHANSNFFSFQQTPLLCQFAHD